jgi:hypothetical protein
MSDGWLLVNYEVFKIKPVNHHVIKYGTKVKTQVNVAVKCTENED